MISTLHKTEPIAVNYLTDAKAIYFSKPKPTTKQLRAIKDLTEKEMETAHHHLTLSYHLSDMMIDVLDEMKQMNLLKGFPAVLDFQNEIEKILSFFAEKAISAGKDDERIQQQKTFETFFKAVVKLNPNDLEKVINYTLNVAKEK